jgi:hypothetical protein
MLPSNMIAAASENGLNSVVVPTLFKKTACAKGFGDFVPVTYPVMDPLLKGAVFSDPTGPIVLAKPTEPKTPAISTTRAPFFISLSASA